MKHMSKVFAGTHDSVAAAREYVGGYFEAEDRDSAMLALSEIATNAITHGGGGAYQVTICVGDLVTRVLVKGFQNAATELTPRLPSHDEPGGRGLLLVNACTSAWGSLIDSDGVMAVWFDIEHDRASIVQAA